MGLFYFSAKTMGQDKLRQHFPGHFGKKRISPMAPLQFEKKRSADKLDQTDQLPFIGGFFCTFCKMKLVK
jgi:hypothetical protein